MRLHPRRTAYARPRHIHAKRTRALNFDILDDRILLSVGSGGEVTLAGHTVQSALPISLLPMQPFTLPGSFHKGKPIDSWSEKLQAGDNLAISVKQDSTTSDPLRIEVLSASGKLLAKSDVGTDPQLFFAAQKTGKYIVEVIDKTPKAKGTAHYELTLQEFAINTGTPLASATQEMGKRWAWVDGNTLTIVDPSGQGFGITSNWTKTVQTDPSTGLQFATYTTDGTSTITMSVANDLMPSGPMSHGATDHMTMTITGPMTIATDPGQWGGDAGTIAWTAFGGESTPIPQMPVLQIASSGIHTDLATVSQVKPADSQTLSSVDATQLFNMYSSQYGLGVTDSGLNFGMASGAAIMAMPSYAKIPLRPDGTYFYAQYNSAASIQFGGATATASKAQTVTIIIDPSDPFLYVAGGPIAFGASMNGLIPFVAASSAYTGPRFSGHLYGAIQGIQIGDLPLQASGDQLINLDPNGTGHLFGLGGNASPLFTTAGLKVALPSLGIGVDGTLSAGETLDGVSFTIPLGSATASYVSPGADPIYVLKPQYLGKGLLPTIPKALLIAFQSTFTYRKSTIPGIPSIRIPTGTVENADAYMPGPQTTPRAGALALAGSTTNPLAGTPVASFFQGTQFSFSAGSYGNTLSDLANNIQATYHYQQGQAIKFGSYSFGGPSQSFDITANSSSVTFSGTTDVFVGTATVSGNVSLQTGAFMLIATLNSGSGNISILSDDSSLTTSSATVVFANNPSANGSPNFSFYVNLSIGFDDESDFHTPDVDLGAFTIPGIDLGNYGVYGNVSGTIYIDPSNSTYTGSITATGGLVLAGKRVSGTLSSSFSNDVISAGANVGIPGLYTKFIGVSFTL